VSWIRGYLTTIFTCIFMIAVLVSIICSLSLIVFAFRYKFAKVTEAEQSIAFYLLITFICGVAIIPTSLYILGRLERLKS
jgi:uncharacterized membrane protein YqgA involved in biofilm formation